MTETVPAGWTLTNIVCTAGGAEISIGTGTGADFVGNAGFDAGDTTVRAVITAGDTPSCVFTNTKLGRILVDKITDPSGSDQVFTFNPSWSTDDFTLTDAAAPHDSGLLVPGTYSVAEFRCPGGT